MDSLESPSLVSVKEFYLLRPCAQATACALCDLLAGRSAQVLT